MKELKDHVITVRLTATEYEQLKSTSGADQTSMSTVVRKTVLDAGRGENLQKTDQLLSEVSNKLDALIGLLDKTSEA